MKLVRIGWIVSGIIGVLIIFEIIVELILEKNYEGSRTNFEIDFPTKDYKTLVEEIEDPIVLWWSQLVPETNEPTKCGNVSCFFTHNRRFKDHPLQKAFIFYGSDMHALDLPLPRKKGEIIWALFHEESPKNFPPLAFEKPMSMFDLTATFSRYSNLPLTLQYLEDEEALQTMEYFIPYEEKHDLLKLIAPVLYIQSSCDVPSDRDGYVRELMKYIKIDSYGECLNNKKLPEDISDPVANLMSDKFLHFISRYKFIIAFENAVCHDYITEKLWRSLMVGSIPIYYGSPAVSDWLPNEKSAIFATDFDSPKSLSIYLNKVLNNATEYNSYLAHKLGKDPKAKISNRQLKRALKLRPWKVNDESEGSSHIENFECLVCHAVHTMITQKTLPPLQAVSHSHLRCEAPVSPLTRKINITNWWTNAWRVAKCEGLVMSTLVNSNFENYTKTEFESLLENYYHNGIC